MCVYNTNYLEVFYRSITMKPWYKSKIIWVNILTIVAVIISAVLPLPELESVAPYLTTGLAIVNVVLRVITNKGINL